MPKPAGTSALQRGLGILRAIATAPLPPTLGEIAQAVGLSPSTTYRLLVSLARDHWVVRSPSKRYQIGPAAWTLLPAMSGEPPEVRRARTLLRTFSEHSQEIAAAAVLAPPYVVYFAREEGAQAMVVQVRNYAGTRAPVFGVASGTALVAAHPAPTWPRFGTGPLPPTVRQRLEEAQQLGYAICLGTWSPEVNSVGIALRDHRGVPQIGLEIAAPRARLPLERARELGIWMKQAAGGEAGTPSPAVPQPEGAASP